MYDRSASGRRLTYKQKAWIEKVYYGQKLDRQGDGGSQRVAKLRYPGLKKEALVTTIEQFQKVCPGILQSSDQFKKIARFFRSGGEVLHLTPSE